MKKYLYSLLIMICLAVFILPNNSFAAENTRQTAIKLTEGASTTVRLEAADDWEYDSCQWLSFAPSKSAVYKLNIPYGSENEIYVSLYDSNGKGIDYWSDDAFKKGYDYVYLEQGKNYYFTITSYAAADGKSISMDVSISKYNEDNNYKIETAKELKEDSSIVFKNLDCFDSYDSLNMPSSELWYSFIPNTDSKFMFKFDNLKDEYFQPEIYDSQGKSIDIWCEYNKIKKSSTGVPDYTFKKGQTYYIVFNVYEGSTYENTSFTVTNHTHKWKITDGGYGYAELECATCGKEEYDYITIKLSTTKYTYDGSIKKPAVTLKSKILDIPKEAYKISYDPGCKKPGTYSVYVKYLDEFKKLGEDYVYFQIRPKSTSIKSLSSGKGTFTVSWIKKSPYIDGYQIQYSTSSKFTTKKTATVYSGTKKTVKTLKSGKTYYVRVRTSYGVYSTWSEVKKIKVK